MSTDIRHEDTDGRFVISLDGEDAGYVAYEGREGSWVFTHTVVYPQFRGRGVAAELVGHALDEAIAAGVRIVPVCSYVVTYIENHPKYAEFSELRR